MRDHGSIAAALDRTLLGGAVNGLELGDAWIRLEPRIFGRPSERPGLRAGSQRQEPAG
jgi:hypothetical protein